MKHVVISVGKDDYDVDSLGDDLKPLPEEQEVGIMLAVVFDRMIASGFSKKMIMNIAKDTYKNRHNRLN